MNVDITQIPYSGFTPNSLLVIKMPQAAMGDRVTIDRLTQGLREKVDPSIDVLMLRDDMEVTLLPESVMNRAGWFRGERVQ